MVSNGRCTTTGLDNRPLFDSSPSPFAFHTSDLFVNGRLPGIGAGQGLAAFESPWGARHTATGCSCASASSCPVPIFDDYGARRLWRAPMIHRELRLAVF